MATTSPYNSAYYEWLMTATEASAQRIVPLVLELVKPRSIVDVGCGSGIWLAIASESPDVDEIQGVDGDWVTEDMLRIPATSFEAHDLSRPLRLERRFDLAMSIEVGEHLPDASADGFVESICALAPVVLFSAAVPGQRGADHINEQWPSYWRRKFEARGYVAVDAIRPQIWEDDQVAGIYRQNLVMYCNAGHLGDHPALAAARERTEGAPFDVVHPKVYGGAVARGEDLRQVATTSFKRALGPARPLAQRAKRVLGR